jgi:HlyD family secretion protein
MKGYLIPALALLGFCLGAYTVIAGSAPLPAAQALSEPSRSPFAVFLSGSGIIEAQSENIAIASPVGGVVEEVHIEVGQAVAQGDPLFTLDQRQLKADLAVQLASARVSQAELGDAQTQFSLRQNISDPRAVSREEFAKRKATLEIAEAKNAEAKAKVDALRTELDRRTVRAPVNGTILQVKVRPGEYAPAQALDNPLILLGDLSALHLRIDVDENDAWRVSPEAKARAFVRGNSQLATDLEFVRIEPYVLPKRSLTGASAERVDTRVLQVVYRFNASEIPVYTGQLMDAFIEAKPLSSVKASKETL